MRIKLSLLPPFAPSKYLFPLPSAITTISDLKSHIIRSFSVIAEVVPKPTAKTLILEVDGFELLPGSSVDVIEAQDIVTVRLRPESSSALTAVEVSSTTVNKKRKAKSAERETSKRAKSVRASLPSPAPIASKATSVHPPPPLPQPKADSSSSEESSSSSLSSSESSDTSSSEESSSDSESNSEPKHPSKIPGGASSSKGKSPNETFPVLSKRPLPPVLVPPGQGKPTTHDRNLRRRKARQMRKLAASAELGPTLNNIVSQSSTGPSQVITEEAPAVSHIKRDTGGANDVLNVKSSAIGVSGSSLITTTFTSSELPVPRRMENRNKKKGFLKEMISMRGMKTTFHDPSEQQLDGAPKVTLTNGSLEKSGAVSHKEADVVNEIGSDCGPFAVVPEAVPRRVVPPSELPSLPSNVFVTSKVYPFSRRGCDWKRRPVLAVGPEDKEEAREDEEKVAEAKVGDATVDAFQPTKAWDAVEEMFDTLLFACEQFDKLHTGSILAHKELTLDMTTFSPEIKVVLSRVTAVDMVKEIVHMMTIPKPGYIPEYEEVYEGEGASEEEEVDEAVALSKVQMREREHRLVPEEVSKFMSVVSQSS